MIKLKRHWGDLLFSILLLFLVALAWPVRTEAAQGTRRLFTIYVKDGTGTQKIPVYEYTTNGKVTVNAKKSQRTVTINIGSGTASLSIKDKTAYYKKNYSKLLYLQTLALTSSSGRKSFFLTAKDGTERKFQLLFKQPSFPKITELSFDKSAMVKTGDSISIYGDISSEVACTAVLNIKNSEGKVVYRTSTKLSAGKSYEAKWEGYPSTGNAAGLDPAENVSSGTYTAQLILKYKYGKKTKKVSAKEDFTVADTEKQAEAVNNAWSGVSWGWKMYLSGDETIDYAAEVICREVLKPNMTQVQRARALYDWIASHYSYHRGAPEAYVTGYPVKIKTTSTKAKKQISQFSECVKTLLAEGKAETVTLNSYFDQAPSYWYNWCKSGLIHQVGDCLIIGSCYSILLRHAGIEADILEHGTQGGASHHFYNIIKINGKYYMADVDVAVEGGGTSLGYTYFLRGSSFAQTQAMYTSASLNSRKINAALYKKLSAKDCPGRTA